jgi:outer membrane protein TolC
MGLIGIGGSKPSALTDLDSISALAMPQLSWSFLDFGRDEAEATYRQTVLGALKDAEDALTRFGHRRETLAAQA